ncbi:hypothetical protein EPI10_016042 [Gossypium australe]|uniref:Uncharacterized protein n=1 Tax=Gossypium australe TaxID=47621 RepID=A0A5B6VMN1_9ROSI|nr:hypothetical protein EPI10_016042 [Gossypium australe]
MCPACVPFEVATHARVPSRGILTCTSRPVTRPCVRPCGAYYFNSISTPGGTRLCNMTVCHTRLRHTPVWTKIGYLPSQFATYLCIYLHNPNGTNSRYKCAAKSHRPIHKSYHIYFHHFNNQFNSIYQFKYLSIQPTLLNIIHLIHHPKPIHIKNISTK